MAVFSVAANVHISLTQLSRHIFATAAVTVQSVSSLYSWPAIAPPFKAVPAMLATPPRVPAASSLPTPQTALTNRTATARLSVLAPQVRSTT